MWQRFQRALTQSFKKIAIDKYTYIVHSPSGRKYTVNTHKFTCSCIDYSNGNICKHLLFTLMDTNGAHRCQRCLIAQDGVQSHKCPDCNAYTHIVCHAESFGQCITCATNIISDFVCCSDVARLIAQYT